MLKIWGGQSKTIHPTISLRKFNRVALCVVINKLHCFIIKITFYDLKLSSPKKQRKIKTLPTMVNKSDVEKDLLNLKLLKKKRTFNLKIDKITLTFKKL